MVCSRLPSSLFQAATNGGGKFILSAANTYSNDTVVNAGGTLKYGIVTGVPR